MIPETMTNRDQDLIERLNARAATMNGIQPVGAGDGDTYAVGYYGASDAKLDREAATALASSATRIAELEARLEAAPSPSPAPGVVTDDGLDQFTAYFVKNYPGPETIIHDPKWHAPRIFRAAKAASLSQPAKGEREGGGVEPFDDKWLGDGDSVHVSPTPANPAQVTDATEDRRQFKNFHRLLCERFGYTHDEKDWFRDQVSLIEHIAAIGAGGQAVASPVSDDYFIQERDDDMLICAKHWQHGSICIARRPKLATNDEWRSTAQDIVNALSALTHPAPSGQAVAALQKAREFIEDSAFNVPTKDYFDAVLKDIDAALAAAPAGGECDENILENAAKAAFIKGTRPLPASPAKDGRS